MLHDPKWNHGTLAGLITWLEGKPRDGEYRFANCQDCLIAQYMGGTIQADWSEDMKAIYRGHDVYKIAMGPEPFLVRQTYGAALERAYAARAALVAA